MFKKGINTADLETAKPLYEASINLCAAIKKYKCLHDIKSINKSASPQCRNAWQLVANECNESVEFCKNRWKSLRRCFFDGLNRRGNKYYLHDHLKFLLEREENPKGNSVAGFNDETNSSTNDSLSKSYGNTLRDLKFKNIYDDEDDDDDVKSISSQTSYDSSNENLQQMKICNKPNKNIQQTDKNGIFIINEFDDESLEADKSFPDDLDEKRFSYKRTCKRPLDPEVIDELTQEGPEEKRSRKSDKRNVTSQLQNKSLKVRVDKLKINLAENKVEFVRSKMIDRETSTDPKHTREIGTQCEPISSNFDDIFTKSISTQLHKMNPRQKMNFKRKMYQSMLEVLDDATDFPNNGEALPLPPKAAPCAANTTVGELRLMRELVSLVHAAKSTPEIMEAKEKFKTSTPVQIKPAVKMPLPIVKNGSKPQPTSPAVSPSPEDEDLQFFIDNLDDEEDVPLPRSWDEIRAKTTEAPKVTSEENVQSLPRRILQKVVRVSGPTGGTIVTRDGDKKRIYRIFPKLVNQNGSQTLPKNMQEGRKDSGLNTMYVSSNKTIQDTTRTNKNVSNTNARPLNYKPASQSPTSANNSSNISTNSAINGQTIFKNVHPANRILSATSGFFTMMPKTKTITPTYTQKQTTITSVGPTTSMTSKVMTTKLPISPMLPPTSNITTKRVQAVRAAPQIAQRRYSICGPLHGEKAITSSPDSVATTSKTIISTNNNSPQIKQGTSQIQISQPISLNAKSLNSQMSSNTQNDSQSKDSKASDILEANVKDIKVPILSEESPDESVADKLSTANQSVEVPILETAGTVEADDLDPLFVNQPQVKREPIDD